MRDHYWRMRTYSPYFDSRTSWYGGAWAYKDAYAIYRGSSLLTEHPEWILKDPAGNRLYIPYACDGSSCTQYAADIGNPEWRRYYIDAAKAFIVQGYRGIFVDDVNLSFNVGDGAGQLVAPIDPRTGRPMTHDAWQRYFAEFMEQLRAELPASAEIVQNQVYFHVGLSSPYVKRAIEASTHIEVERGVNDTGIRGGTGTFGFETVLAWIDYAHSRGKGVIYDVQTDWGREYALATYLLNSTGRDGIGMDVGALPDDWWSGWDTDLGAALGGRYTWNGVFRRDFVRGSVFVNQPDRPSATVAPGGSWKRLDGSTRHVGEPAGARRRSCSCATMPFRRRRLRRPPPRRRRRRHRRRPPVAAGVGVAADRPRQGSAGLASSAEHATHSADKAVDAVAGTRFGSGWTDGQWWQVDLGAPTTVGKVAIEWEAAYASTYRILTSLDGENWTQQASVSLTSAVTKVTTFEPITARYVRILGVDRATQYGISFWEVHVYRGDAPPPVRPADPPAPPAAPPAPPVAPVPAGPTRPGAATAPAPPARAPAAARPQGAALPDDHAAPLRQVGAKRRAACRARAKRRAAALRAEWTNVRGPRNSRLKRRRGAPIAEARARGRAPRTGKPVARRGRKARGLCDETAQLPKGTPACASPQPLLRPLRPRRWQWPRPARRPPPPPPALRPAPSASRAPPSRTSTATRSTPSPDAQGFMRDALLAHAHLRPLLRPAAVLVPRRLDLPRPLRDLSRRATWRSSTPSGSCATPPAASCSSRSTAAAAPAPSTPATSATPPSGPTGSPGGQRPGRSATGASSSTT